MSEMSGGLPAPVESAARRVHAVVVGASLSGLMTALTLSRAGLRVTVLERAGSSRPSGAAIRVDADLLQRLTGLHDKDVDADGGDANWTASGLPQSWSSVHNRLMGAASADPAITLHHDTSVVEVGQDHDAAWAVTTVGNLVAGDVVVGADGHRSTVRRAVCPERPDARFAGYVLWLGIAPEADLGVEHDWPREVAFLDGIDDILLGYPLPGAGGSLVPGRRQLGFAWFDAGRNDLLRSGGHVREEVVHHSLAPSDIPAGVLTELTRQARAQWPSPWREAVLHCIGQHALVGTPIAEYVPDRLVNGRLALVGDAAHVPTPMTGTGFNASVLDAEALAAAVTGTQGGFEVVRRLRRYEEQRLSSVRSMVHSGQDFSRSFTRGAT